jgi:2-(1,2-epoxy-1,2-dihydrophenyl)acetyl-CoA isomerase
MEMALLDERIPAPQALEWGMINRVVPSDDLIPTAMGIATQLASGPTKAYSHIRKLVWKAAEQPYDAMLDEEVKTQSALGRTEDHRTGVKAFMTREKPNFKGQ